MILLSINIDFKYSRYNYADFNKEYSSYAINALWNNLNADFLRESNFILGKPNDMLWVCKYG